MSDIKSILKEKNFNKEQLAVQIDSLTNKILSKGVYVIEKTTEGFYNIRDYVKKTLILSDIPTYAIADSLCNVLNNTKRGNFNIKIAESLIRSYHKITNDCVHYRYTIKSTKDDFRKEVVYTRLDLSVQHLKRVKNELMRL